MRDHWGTDEGTTGTFPGGATLRSAARGWVLAEDQPERALGGALAWARHHGVAELHVLAEQATPLLARRALGFANPPQVWHVEGRSLALATPGPRVLQPSLPAEVEAFVGVLADAAVEPVV